MFSLLDNFTDLPDDLISADLRIGDASILNNSDGGNNLINSNSTPQQVSSNTTPPQQQQQQQQQQNTQPSNAPQPIPPQGSPVPNSNALNQRPPLSSPQPPSSISSSGDPTPTMPCVSSTPTHNVASSAGHSMQGSPLQMMSMSSSVSPNQQQMANYSMPNSQQFTSSTMMGSPHPGMGHMGGPQPHMMAHMQQRLRPTSHGGMTGPLRVGMPNQHAMMPPNMSHHGGMVRPAMGVGGMVPHQNMGHRMSAGMGQMQMGPQYIHQHPPGHPAMHGHQMVPSQPQVGGPNMMTRHMMPGGPIHMQPNMMHPGSQSHMVSMHQNQRFVPRPGVPGGGVPNNMMPPDESQMGMSAMQPRLQGGATAMMRPNGGMVGSNQVRLPPPPPHNDAGGQQAFRGSGMVPSPQPQQQQPIMSSSTGPVPSTGGTINTMPGNL